MTSKILANIDGTFPVAGQDNSTQGFRDNFTNTNNNFTYAAEEISDLQSKAILKSALADGTLDNNMYGTEIANPKLRGIRETILDMGYVTGSIGLSFISSSYFSMTLSGSVVFALQGFTETAGSFTKIKVQINVPNVAYTVTFPSSVNTNLSTIAGAVGQVVTFDAPGTYMFELATVDGGNNFLINDLTRNRDLVQGGNFAVMTSISNVYTTGINMTVSNIGGHAVGNVYASNFFGNIITTSGNSAAFAGNVTAGNVSANTAIYGNIATPVQTAITLIGTQSSLSVSGNANVGNITVTGLSDFCGGDAYGIQFVNATNTGTTQVLSNVGVCIVNPTSSTIASHTVVMPATPYAGQVIRIGFANTITALTQSGTGTDTVHGAFTSASVDLGGTWVYVKNAQTNSGYGAWYRIG